MKDKLREESLKDLSRDRILQMIEEGFETARAPVNISRFPLSIRSHSLSAGKTLQQTSSLQS